MADAVIEAIFPPRHREPRQEQRAAAWGRREHDGMGTPPPHAALEPQWLSGVARVHTAGYVGTGLRSPPEQLERAISNALGVLG